VCLLLYCVLGGSLCGKKLDLRGVGWEWANRNWRGCCCGLSLIPPFPLGVEQLKVVSISVRMWSCLRPGDILLLFLGVFLFCFCLASCV